MRPKALLVLALGAFPALLAADHTQPNMKPLIELAKASPTTLSDKDLAKAFMHLVEFPEDDYQSSDLVGQLLTREGSGTYEVLRALALYYAHLQGDLFPVGEGEDYDKKYLRAVEYVDRAYSLRDPSYDERLRRFGEFEDSSLERDLVFGIRSLLGNIHELHERIREELGAQHELVKRSEGFVALEKKVSGLDSPLAVLQALQPVATSYAAFVKRSFAVLPKDD